MRKNLRSKHTQADYGFIYNGCREKHWYWEWTLVVKKLTLILVYKMITDYNPLIKVLLFPLNYIDTLWFLDSANSWRMVQTDSAISD